MYEGGQFVQHIGLTTTEGNIVGETHLHCRACDLRICLSVSGEDRPPMKQVAMELQELIKQLK